MCLECVPDIAKEEEKEARPAEDSRRRIRASHRKSKQDYIRTRTFSCLSAILEATCRSHKTRPQRASPQAGGKGESLGLFIGAAPVKATPGTREAKRSDAGGGAQRRDADTETEEVVGLAVERFQTEGIVEQPEQRREQHRGQPEQQRRQQSPGQQG